MQQHSAEWWAIRCGKVTASRIGDIMGRTQKGQPRAERARYLKEKVAERITGKPKEQRRIKTIKSLDERLEMEPDARSAYEFYNECSIEVVGFFDHPRIPDAGCSPDGLVGTDGGVEIKCHDAEQHLEIIQAEAFDPDYVWQCHFNLACTGRQWWDLTAFNADVPEKFRIYVKRIERDEALIATIETNVIEFLAEVEQKIAQLQDIVGGKSALTSALEGSLANLQVN